MPLYEIHGTGNLIPFRRLQGDKLYEREIEDLFWANAEEFIGETATYHVQGTAGHVEGIFQCWDF